MARPLPPGGLPSGRASVSAICEVTAEVNHLRPYSRHSAPSRSARVSERPTSEPPVVSVIHCPLVQNVAGSRDGQVRNRPPLQLGAARGLQAADGAVGHGERAGVDVRRRVEQVDLQELRDSGVSAERPVVAGRDEPVLRRETLCLAPERSDHDLVDATAPGVPLREHGLVEPVRELQSVEFAARHGAELAQFLTQPALERRPRQGSRAATSRAADRPRTGCRARVAPG